MKKTLLFIAAVICGSIAFAQTADYPLDTVRGKVYYRYPVQKGEGLYRISKNFSVSQEDIVSANPELQKSGLKLGQVILVPAVLPVDSAQYIVHELQPKETLYGVSRLYGVKIAQIEELNPETSKTMRIGERLLIPKTDRAKATAEKIESLTAAKTEQTAVHNNEDKQPESQNNESKQNVGLEVTLNAQPDTASDKRSAEQIKKLVEESFAQQTDSSRQTDYIQLSVDSITADTLLSNADSTLINSLPAERPIEIAILLPLMTDVPKRDASVERFMEFYEGLLLAVDNAQTNGQRFIIRTFDTDKTEARILSILADSALLGVDAIVGPAYPQQVTLVAGFAKEHEIPVVIPFTSKVADIDTNPWLLQFNPNEQAEAKAVAAWAEQQSADLKCIFFNDDNAEPASSVAAIKEELARSNLTIANAPLSALLADSAEYIFDDTRLNLVVLPSDRYSAVQPALQHLSKQSGKYRICLMSEYAWQKEKISLKQIYTCLFDPQNGNALDRMMYKLMRKAYFPSELKNDSPCYDLLGYDLTSWLITMLRQQGETLGDKILTAGDFEGLQSDMHFERIGEEGGWMNTALKVIE